VRVIIEHPTLETLRILATSLDVSFTVELDTLSAETPPNPAIISRQRAWGSPLADNPSAVEFSGSNTSVWTTRKVRKPKVAPTRRKRRKVAAAFNEAAFRAGL
jgi:hypothetical protein